MLLFVWNWQNKIPVKSEPEGRKKIFQFAGFLLGARVSDAVSAWEEFMNWIHKLPKARIRRQTAALPVPQTLCTDEIFYSNIDSIKSIARYLQNKK